MVVATHLLILSILTAFSLWVNAETTSSHDFGHHTIHYSVFNSTMIQPEIASAHKLKRASNLAYINIAVVDNSDSNNYGIAAEISGRSRNLLQQQQLLRFIAIKEQTATYYLAPIYYNNEDIYHFDITVIADKQTPAKTFTFTKTLYVE
jgi:Domain of unknown function (DUF4426)